MNPRRKIHKEKLTRERSWESWEIMDKEVPSWEQKLTYSEHVHASTVGTLTRPAFQSLTVVKS
jgi:hypothetical protein